jgi:hypothetical protein
MSRFAGYGTPDESSSSAPKARTSGIRTSQTRPPLRPLRGLRGEWSQSASRTVDQRRLPCSRATRAATRTNCQTRPAVRQRRSALASGTLPSPERRSATAGATSQASAAIGSAAAAQVARIARLPYCGISTAGDAATARDGAVSGSEISMGIPFVECMPRR